MNLVVLTGGTNLDFEFQDLYLNPIPFTSLEILSTPRISTRVLEQNLAYKLIWSLLEVLSSGG